MTYKHGSKKRIRQYADEHGISYTQAQSALNGTSLDALVDKITNHDQIDTFMLDTSAQRDVELVASYIPLLDALNDPRWLLEVGQSATQIALSDTEHQYLTVGSFESGWPQRDDVFELHEPLSVMDGASIIAHVNDFPRKHPEQWDEFVANTIALGFGDVDALDDVYGASVRVRYIGIGNDTISNYGLLTGKARPGEVVSVTVDVPHCRGAQMSWTNALATVLNTLV